MLRRPARRIRLHLSVAAIVFAIFGTATSAQAITIGKLMRDGDKEVTLVGDDWTLAAACDVLAKRVGMTVEIDRAGLAKAGVDVNRKFALTESKQPALDVLARLLTKVSPERRACVVIVKHTEETAVLRITAYSKELDEDGHLLYVQEKLP
jgi:hypothetical protein